MGQRKPTKKELEQQRKQRAEANSGARRGNVRKYNQEVEERRRIDRQGGPGLGTHVMSVPAAGAAGAGAKGVKAYKTYRAGEKVADGASSVSRNLNRRKNAIDRRKATAARQRETHLNRNVNPGRRAQDKKYEKAVKATDRMQKQINDLAHPGVNRGVLDIGKPTKPWASDAKYMRGI